jgi:hypothetical protein
MPAPKAVLCDLNDFGMDPTKPWSVTHNMTGRLNPPPKTDVKLAPVKLPEEKKTAPTVHKVEVKVEKKPASVRVEQPKKADVTALKAEEAVKPVEKPTPVVRPPVVKATMKVSPAVEPTKEGPKVEIATKAEEVNVEELEAKKPVSSLS